MKFMFKISNFEYIIQNLFICQMDFDNILDNLFLRLNEVRLHPFETAQAISQLRNAYQGNMFKNQYKTREGPKALDNLIVHLAQHPPATRRLKWSFALHMVADQMATELGKYGIFTTQGTPHHITLPDRVKNFAIVKGRLSEVYQFGGKSADQILQQLLIDDGLASRKRRNTLLDPIYQYIGIGSSYHEKNQSCTVILLAQDIVSLVAPHKDGTYLRRDLQSGKKNAFKLFQQIVLNVPKFANNQPSPTPTNNLNQSVPTPPPSYSTPGTSGNSIINPGGQQPSQIQQPSINPQFILAQDPNTNRNTMQSQISVPGFNVIPPPPSNNNQPQTFLAEMNNIRSSNVSNISQNINNMDAGQSVTYNNNVPGIGGSNVGQSVTYNNNNVPGIGGSNAGQSVTYSNPNIPNNAGQSVTYNNTSNIGGSNAGQSVNYSPISGSQVQQQQYQFYKSDPNSLSQPQINTITNPPVNPNPNVQIVSTPPQINPVPQKKQSSRCSIM